MSCQRWQLPVSAWPWLLLLGSSCRPLPAADSQRPSLNLRLGVALGGEDSGTRPSFNCNNLQVRYERAVVRREYRASI